MANLFKRYGIHLVYHHSFHAPVYIIIQTCKGIGQRFMVWQQALVLLCIWDLKYLMQRNVKGATKDQAVVASIKAVLLEYGEALSQAEDKARGLTSVLRAIVWRAEEYWEDLFEIATMPNGEPCLEQRFEVPFGNGYRFSGRIDKIVQLDGKLYLCDVKTTKSTLNSNYFSNFMPNNQVFAYLWAAREVLGLDIVGFIVDAVQTGVHFTRFNRSVYNVPTELIKEWYEDALTYIRYINKLF